MDRGRDRDMDTESDRDRDNGSWSPGAAPAVDGASLLQVSLQADNHAETEQKVNGWTSRGLT